MGRGSPAGNNSPAVTGGGPTGDSEGGRVFRKQNKIKLKLK